MTEIELAWLAGILEGEGSFMCGHPSDPGSVKISMMSTDKDIVERVATLIGNKCSSAQFDGRNPNWKPAYQIQVRGRRAAALMRRLYPLMGKRRQGQILRALNNDLAGLPEPLNPWAKGCLK